MKQVIFNKNKTETIDADLCNLFRLLIIPEGNSSGLKIGVIVTVYDEGLPSFKVVWADGIESEWYKSIKALKESYLLSNHIIYQI